MKEWSVPSAASASAINCAASGDGAPINCVRARAGFASGPIRLNTVRIFSSRRTGAGMLHRRMEVGRKQESDPDLANRAAASSGVMEMRIPSASRTSALPSRW